VVKIEDKRVSLSEIERRLLALPGVEDAAALAIQRHGRHAIGVVLALPEMLDAATLHQLKIEWKRALQPWLEPVAIPRYWRVVTSIPVTAQSKRAWPQIEELFDAAG
jgi:acyl-coenzyme A synthetase/AMP-(fatty) acid ligase